ncbi:MAG: nitroreductase family deazaflavin-dependent oxidoreductase [Chloroflexaceae bacterium]|nr:nitroreductase family deazaflavin-dependent oxidoreductase [Chloroflexaceae bacterium]
MTTMQDNGQRIARQAFQYLNTLVLLKWRMGLGRYINIWPQGLGRFMVLVHTGRKTGMQRRTPTNYTAIDGDIYVAAGFGKVSHWYKNIMANPRIEIWMDNGWWEAEAEDITGGPRHTELMREVLKGSGFAAYVAGINPYTMSDEALDTATASYRLLRIRRTTPRTGAGGPDDLVWLWPVLLIGVGLVAVRRKQG